MTPTLFWNISHTAYDLKSRLRPGLEEVLSKFKEEGFTQYFVDVLLEESDVSRELTKINLRKYFDRVFGREHQYIRGPREWNLNSDYAKISATLNAPLEELKKYALVLGGSNNDSPVNSNGMVFFGDPSAHLSHAQVTEQVIRTLLMVGQGEFLRGFEEMYKDVEVTRSNFMGSNFEHRYVGLGMGIMGNLSYGPNLPGRVGDEKVIPTINDLHIPKCYLRKDTQ